MYAAKMNGTVLACTDDAVLPVNAVFDVMRELGNGGVEHSGPLVLTCASSLSEWVACSLGANFTPHIITVNSGEEFNDRWEVDCYLSASGYLGDNTRPFFVALPKDRGNVSNEAAPATLALLEQLCSEVTSELARMDSKIQATSDIAHLWKSAMLYAASVCNHVIKWLTGGDCIAGMHEVVCTNKTTEAIKLAQEQSRSLWRVSSTWFAHIASDAVLKPLGHFAESPLASKYPPLRAGMLNKNFL